MTTIADILEGATISESVDGTEAVRVFHVEGLSGDAPARAASALTAPGVPRLNEPHPTIQGATVAERAISYVDADNAVIRVIYRTPAPGVAAAGVLSSGGVTILSVDFSAATFNEPTSRDINGQLMLNRYVATNVFQQVVEVDAFRPQLVVRIRHTRPDLPKALAKRFIGSVNADRWGGDPAEVWLCTGLSTSLESGQIVCTLEALYKGNSWRIPHVMTVEGVPVTLEQLDISAPPKKADGTGVATYQIYRLERFADLGLDW